MSEQVQQSYVSAVRALFTPPGSRDDRGGAGPASYPEIEARAKEVLGLSDDLMRAERARLESDDPSLRAVATQRLLAKAATELEISKYLKDAGDDEHAGAALSSHGLFERTSNTKTGIDEYLSIIVASAPLVATSPDRTDRTTTKVELTTIACDNCDLISKNAGVTAKSAFEGFMGVGLTEIGQAAGAVAVTVAGALGAESTLGRLYALCRDFVKKVFDSVIALIGDQLAKLMGEKVVKWLEEAKGHVFADWLASAYGVQSIKNDLTHKIEASQAGTAQFSAARNEVDALTRRFASDDKLTGRLISGLGWLSYVPGLASPQGLLFRAGGYALLLGWAVLNGGDYLDSTSPYVGLLRRVPGIPEAVSEKI